MDFSPEKRNGFFVTSDRKKLWNLELNMLEDFNDICEKHDLKWFLHYGAALGAIRHKGFIPWDDDVDLGMPRYDFNKFLTIIDELPNNIVVQYGYNEEDCCTYTFCRLRDKNSSGILQWEMDRECVKGVFLEIYPFDEVPNNKTIRTIHWKLSLFLDRLIGVIDHGDVSQPGLKTLIKKIIKKLDSKNVFKIWNYICQMFNGTGKKYVENVSVPHYSKSQKCLFKKDLVENTIRVPFESIYANIVSDYDLFLTQLYGDYLELPPEGKRGTHHNEFVYYDAELDYLTALKSGIPQKYFSGDYSLSKI